MSRCQHLAASALISLAALAPASHARAQSPTYTLGQKLTPVQIQALGALPGVDIQQRSYRLLSTSVSSLGLPMSTVLAPDDRVGQTFHEVLIAEMPTQAVRQQFAAVLAPAASVQYQDHADLTVARFATLQQAAAALQQIQRAKPGVEAGLPISFSRPRLH